MPANAMITEEWEREQVSGDVGPLSGDEGLRGCGSCRRMFLDPTLQLLLPGRRTPPRFQSCRDYFGIQRPRGGCGGGCGGARGSAVGRLTLPLR